MERLTIPDVRIDEKTKKITVIDSNKVRENAMEIYWHLKEIEDILGDDYDLDRLRELVEAGRDGRCVVLPVKVGDTVYDTTIEDITGEIRAMTVASEVFFRSKSFNRLDFHAENNRGAFMTFNHRDIGRSVFRTREAAEAALKGEAYGG